MLHNCNKVENRVACLEYARGGDPCRDIYARLSFFPAPALPRAGRDRVQLRDPWPGPPTRPDDFGILLDRAVIEIGFAAPCVTFVGFRANIETQRISFAHRRTRCNRKSNGRPSPRSLALLSGARPPGRVIG